jgi:hypothetical protein
MLASSRSQARARANCAAIAELIKPYPRRGVQASSLLTCLLFSRSARQHGASFRSSGREHVKEAKGIK